MARLAGGAGVVGAVSTAAAAAFGGLTPHVAHLLLEWTEWFLIPGAKIAVMALVCPCC